MPRVSAVHDAQRGVIRTCAPDHDGDHTLIVLHGEHDLATSASLTTVLAQAGEHDVDVVVDLSGVTFMDASTLGVLVRADRELRTRGRSLTIRAPSPIVRRVIAVCGLDDLVEGRAVAATTASALSSWVDVPAAPPAARAPTGSGQPHERDRPSA